jgi:hypothetical protein
MTTSSSGFIGSVTHAWRMWVVIGIGTPAMSEISVLQPAVQLRTAPAVTVPRFVLILVTRPFDRYMPRTTVSWWISTPPRSAPRAKPHTTASWRMIPPGG